MAQVPDERDQPLRVFLCHSSGDKSAVRDLCRRLTVDGFAPWLDENELLPGQDWQIEIAKAVRQSHAIAICLSRASVGKEGFVQREIKSALDVANEKPPGTIFIIPVKLEECDVPDRLSQWQWANIYEADGYQRLVRALNVRADALKVQDRLAEPNPVTRLRSQPATLSVNQAKIMVVTRDFYSASWNEAGKGMLHKYETKVAQDELLVIDHATGLAWQKGGSGIPLSPAEEYIRDLNTRKFAGFEDWRLPTLEEAMSLMTTDKDVMHLDRIFEKSSAPFIWTSDKMSEVAGWVVYYLNGTCDPERASFNAYVRAVRTW
jgi:hypothetical protein